VALLGIDARVGAGGVDEGQDRHLEALGQLHQTAGLAVAFRARHAEVATHLLAHFGAFLMTDDHHRLTVQTRGTTNDGGVIGEMAITVQLFDFGEQVLDVIEGVGPLRVPGQAGDLPAGQVAEDSLGERFALVLQAGDFIADVQRVVITNQAQFFDLGLQVGDRLFEIEEIRVHSHPSCVDGQGAGKLFRFFAPYLTGRTLSGRTKNVRNHDSIVIGSLGYRPARRQRAWSRTETGRYRYWRKTLSRPNWSRNT